MFITDTNFLMKDYKNIELIESDITIPITVIHELDNHKNDKGSVGYNTRKSLRKINDAIDNDYTLENGFKLRIDEEEYEDIPKNDNKIIESALNASDATLVTGDVGMKIVAMSRGIKVMKSGDDDDILNPGKVEELVIDYELLQELFSDGKIPYTDIEHEKNYENACFIVRDENKTGFALIRRIGNFFIKVRQPKKIYGKITGRNIAQRLYLDMLMDKRIKIILVNGVAGSGKTLLALAAACQLKESKKFEEVICAKSVEEIGKEIGFRPGEEENKLQPYYAAFNDNLEFLAKPDARSGALRKIVPNVTYEHIGYMRGRTFRDSFMLFDECQNLSPEIIKSIISRAGEGSKVVCCGDLKQIDNNQSEYTNGLFHAQRKLIGNEMVGVITLEKSERSDIAKLCALL